MASATRKTHIEAYCCNFKSWYKVISHYISLKLNTQIYYIHSGENYRSFLVISFTHHKNGEKLKKLRFYNNENTKLKSDAGNENSG